MKKAFVFGILFLTIINLYSLEQYTVIKDDCLWNIAKKYYTNPFLWVKIYQQNKDMIKNPDLIYPGQVFIIPDIETEEKEIIKSTEVSSNELLQTEEKQEQLDQVESTQTVIQYNKLEEKKEKMESVELELQKTIELKKFKSLGKIVSAKEKKFVYIDYDIVFCELENFNDVNTGDIFYIYHLGPSQYDTTLLNVPNEQLNLVGKLKVIEIIENIVVGKIMRAYSPIIIGDMITK
jgi:LysM repeat protein